MLGLQRRAVVVALASAVTLGLTACTPTRSVKTYCDTVDKHKARYVASMKQATSDGGLKGLFEGATAASDLKGMWVDLANAAPDEIRTDTETTRDTWQKVADEEAERDFFAALATSLANAKATQRVNDYIADHCGVDAAPLPVTRPNPQPTPTQTPTANVPQSVIALPRASAGASEWDYGPRAVIAGDVVQTGGSASLSFSGVTAHNGQLERASGNLTPTGGATSLTASAYGAQQLSGTGAPYVVATTSHTDASGLTPKSRRTLLQAYDAQGAAAGQPATFSGCVNDRCHLTDLKLFGRVAVVSYAFRRDDRVTGIDLTSGRPVWTVPDVKPVAVSGGLLVLHGTRKSTAPTFAVTATSGARVWTFHDAIGQLAHEVTSVLDPNYAIVSSSANTTDGSATGRFSITDLRTGRVVTDFFGSSARLSAAFDPTRRRFVLAGVNHTANEGDEDNRLETRDVTGHPLDIVGAAQYAALNHPTVRAAVDGALWIETADGVDVVDSATGTQRPESPKRTHFSGTTTLPTFVDGSIALVTRVGPTETSTAPVYIAAEGSPTIASMAAAR